MYKRNVVWHSTKMLLQGHQHHTYGNHCWAIEDEGDTLIPIHFPARSNFRSHMDLKYRTVIKIFYGKKIR